MKIFSLIYLGKNLGTLDTAVIKNLKKKYES